MAYFYGYNQNKAFRNLGIFLVLISISILIYVIYNPLVIYQATTHDVFERSSDLVRSISNLYFSIYISFVFEVSKWVLVCELYLDYMYSSYINLLYEGMGSFKNKRGEL